MKISLSNIGKIKKADIEIGGIAVIAGENDTGKSTIAKSLYSIINAFYNIDEKIKKDKRENLDIILERISFDISNFVSLKILNRRELFDELLEEFENTENTRIDNIKNIVKSKLLEYNIELNDEIIDGHLKRVNQILSISNKDMQNRIIQNQFRIEFSGEINNIYSDEYGKIRLNLKEKIIEIDINDNRVNIKKIEPVIFVDAIYIDDSFIMDELRIRNLIFAKRSYQNHHRDDLKLMLSRSNNNISRSVAVEEQFKNIYNMISDIALGNFEFDSKGNGVYKNADGSTLRISNISAGLKTFIIVKTLFLNGTIQENGILILDEPEIHLHPKLQLVFAELIVLLQKEFNLHILLSTHSPYFLKAIEVYSKKHEISSKCRYYLTKSLDDKKKNIEVEDVTDKTYEIYKLLAELYNMLNEIEDSIDEF